MPDNVYENINPNVAKQLTIRQEKLAQDPKSSEALIVFNNNVPFIRLASSTDITEDRAKTLNVPNLNGSKLAKEFVLYNGTVGLTGTGIGNDPFKYNPKGGVGNTPDNINNFAYGFGGLQFGYVPMPGIESVTINHAEASGALRKAKIKIRCWNTQQLNILDALFFRLGFSCLLEFGHSNYFNNDRGYQTFNTFSTEPLNLLFQNGTKPKTIETAIVKTRDKYNYNYDGLFGYVTNYSWQYTDNGFLVEIEISSKGAIIDFADAIQKANGNKIITGTIPSVKFPAGPSDNSSIQGLPSAYIGRKNETQVHFGIYEDITNLDNNKVNFISNIENVKATCLKTTFEKTNYYISLGRFLNIIQSTILDDNKQPIFEFDTNITSNLCLTFPQHVSLDPNVCLIPFKFTNPETQEVVLFPNDPQYSSTQGTDFRVPDAPFIGYTMNILVNVDFILDQFDIAKNKNNFDKSGSIKFGALLKNILNGINSALGGLNNLSYFYDDDEGFIKLKEDATIPGSNGQRLGNIFTFNIFGVTDQSSSIIKDLQLQTGFTPNFQNAMLALVATSNKSIAIQKYNQGYQDRILKGALNDVVADTENPNFIDITNPNIKVNKKEIFNALNGVYNVNAQANIKTGLTTLKNVSKTYKTYYISYFKFLAVNYESVTAILPLDLRITIQGISGLKIFNLFEVTTQLLPYSFARSVQFSISGLTNTIDSNGWVTSIDTITRFRDSPKITPTTNIDSSEGPVTPNSPVTL